MKDLPAMPTADNSATPDDDLNGYLDRLDANARRPRAAAGDPLNAYLEHLDELPEPAASAKPRTWGEAASDTARSLAAGVGGVVKSGGQLYGLATGNMDNAATELGQSVQDHWEGGQSAQLKAKKKARSEAIDASDDVLGKAVTAFWETVKDPALAGDVLASNIATLIPGAAAGRLASGVSAARGLAAATKLGPASSAALGAVSKTAGTVGTRTAIGTGALQQGADVAGDVYESAMKKPDTVWASNPEFVVRLAQTDGSAAARQDLKHEFSLRAARVTLPAAAAISVVANAIPGADMLERALVGGGARVVAKAGASYAIPKAMLKGGLGEMAQETIEEGGGAAVGNQAKRAFVDPHQAWDENVGENAGMGAAGGLLMGVGGGAFHGHAPDPLAPVRAAAQQPNSPLSRAATVAAPSAPSAPGAPPAAPVPLTPEQEARFAALTRLGQGAPARVVTGPDGQPMTVPATDAQAFTTAQKQEYDALKALKDSQLAPPVNPTANPAAPPLFSGMPDAGLASMVNNLSQATSPQGRVNTPEDNAMGVAAQAEIDRRAAALRAARPTLTDPINGREVTGDDPRYDMVRAATGMDNAYTGLPAAPGQAPAAPPAADPAAPASADPMYAGAVSVVMGSGKASIALVQRHLKIGYNRAARLVEDMERAGLVSPMGTDGARSVLKPLAEIPNTETAARDRQATQDALAAANLAAGVLPGDTLSPNGTPFKLEKVARSVQRRTFPEMEVTPIQGGFVLRAKATPPATQQDTPAYVPQPEQTAQETSPAPGAQGAAPGEVAGQPAGAAEGDEIEAKIQAILSSRIQHGASGQHGEDIDQIRAALVASQATSAPEANKPFTQGQQDPQAIDSVAQQAPSTDGIQWNNVAPDGPADVAQGAGVTDQTLDKEWTAFAPESGTLNVPRAEMPQVKAEHRGALVNFLKGKGIASHAAEEVPADSLKPTQAEFSPEKVTKAKNFTGGDRSILVSSDGHVVDGHHQWLAKQEAGAPVKVIRLDAPIADLLPIVREFPSAEQSAGAAQPLAGLSAPKAEPAQASTAPAATETIAPADQKAKWIKAILDQNRLAGPTGVQLSVAANGKLTFLGDPKANKPGQALQATLNEALKAGATPAEIAQAIQGKTAPNTAITQGPQAPAATETIAPAGDFKAQALAIADELEQLGGDKDFIAGIRAAANHAPAGHLQQSNIDFYRERLATRKALLGKDGESVREPGTLARYFTEPDQVKLLADARAGDYGDLLAQADARLQALTAFINQAGMLVDQVDARVSDRRLLDAKSLMSHVGGQASRLMNKDKAVSKGYKRADPAALKEAADTLAQQFEAVDAFLARDGAPDAAGDQGEPTQGDQFDSAAFDEKRDQAVKQSRAAGNVHLDKIPPTVETMRGKRVFYVHDPKVRGVIRTVDNRGNVYIDWSDAYSAEKELASPVTEGEKTVYRTSIGRGDLKDYAVERGNAPEAAARPVGWAKSYGTAKTVAESLGIALRGANQKIKKLPELVAEIQARDGQGGQAAPAAPAPAPAPAPDALDYRLSQELRLPRGDVAGALGKSNGYTEAQIRALVANTASHQDALESIKIAGEAILPRGQGYNEQKMRKMVVESLMVANVRTAPEHDNSTGKPLDPNNKYAPIAGGAVTRQDGAIDEGSVPLDMNAADFKEITDEWAVLTAPPDERTITNQRAKAEGFITPEQAAAKLAEWKAHVKKQYDEHGGDNNSRTILSLFDLSGEWSKPWREAGYNVQTFDIQTGQDVNDFSVEYFTENYDLSEVYGILAAAPCTDFSSAGSRFFKTKDADGRSEASKALVFKTLQTIEYFRPAIWALENPVGRIVSLTGIPDARMSFQPHHFGEPTTKPTMLYGNFNAELPLANVAPTEGSKTDKQGGKSQATKNARSVTPEGFAYAFFMANNYIDMPVEAKLTAQYPEASGAVKQALKAGIAEQDIHDLMDATYGNYEYEDARNALVKAVADQNKAPPAAPGTRTNGAPERAAADRLEKLLDTFSAERNTLEGSARAAMRGLVEELRKPRTAVSVIPLLETASQRLRGKFAAQSRVLDEIVDSLQPAAAPAEQAPDAALRFNDPNGLKRAADIRAAIDAAMDANAQLVLQANPATNSRENFQLVVGDAFDKALLSLYQDMTAADFKEAGDRTKLPGYLQRVGDKFIARHYGEQAAAAPAAATKTPIQQLTEPPFLDYRVQETASNSVKLLPPVGKHFTAEQIQQLQAWVNAAGFTGYPQKGAVKVIGQDAPDIPDGLQAKRLAKSAAADKARDDTQAAAAAASAAEYQALPASQWIESTLGADFANAYNKLQLARYLEGGKFEGLTSSSWFAPLERMGFDTSDANMPASRVLDFLRQRYQASRKAAPAPKTDAAQAADILTAAGLTGKARLDVLAQVKDGTFTPEELLAAYPPVVKSEPAAAPAPAATPAPAAVKVSAKEKARALRETEVATFAQLVADASMVGQSVQALSQALTTRLPESRPEQVSKMAAELHKQLLKQAAALEKARHRDPAVYRAAVDGALAQAGLVNDAEKTNRFQAGWAHALAGKTKSTLSGDLLAEQVRGYEGAKAWMGTEEGAAWYEGRPASKLKNTGLDLRRHWELMRAQMKAGESDMQKAWKAIERATNRADLFAPLLSEGVKPGFKLYVTEVRDHIMPFKKWLDDKSNWYGQLQYKSRYAEKKSNLDYILEGTRYPGELSQGDRDNFRDDSAYRADWLRARADEYLARVRQYMAFLDGAESVKDAADQYAALFLVPDPKNTTGNYYTTLATTDAGKAAYSGIFDGTRNEFQRFRPTSDWTTHLIEKEGTIALPKRSDPLTPPKLDRVTRESLADHRKGADVTPDEFKRVFGFADIGFGKWVGARQDQDHLNYAYDAFMDLARHFGMPADNIGFGAQLHFTIGALGHGKFSAHYQRAHPVEGRTVQVINLTNTRGDGTVYHEWVHALDANLGGEWRGVVRNQLLRLLKAKTLDANEIDAIAKRFLIGGTYWKGDKNQGKVDAAIKGLRHYTGLNTGATAYKVNADKLGTDYWGNDEELIARASEAWAADTLGGTNTYLVNPEWVGEGKASPEKGHRGTPYPTGHERELFTQVFQALTRAVKWTDGRPTITAKDFQAALPADPGEERRQYLLERENMQRFHNVLAEAINDKALAVQAAKNDAERAERDAMDAAAAQLLAAMEQPAPAPAAIDPPTPSETQGPLSEEDLSALFDQAAAEVREENQEKPDAPAPGELSPDDALSEEALSALFDQAAAEVRAENAQQPGAPAPTEDVDASDLDAPEGRDGWESLGYIVGDDGVGYGVSLRDIRTSNHGAHQAVRQIRIYDDNGARYMAVWEWRSAKPRLDMLADLRIDLAIFHYAMSDATAAAFGADAADGDALWARHGASILESLGQRPQATQKPLALAPAPKTEPAAPAAPSPAWSVEELNELLEKAHQGDMVAISNGGGIPGVPTLQDIGELGATRHVGMGMFETSGTDDKGKPWKINWDGGGAMNRLTSGKPYTNVSLNGPGVAPWPSGVRRAIEQARDAQAEARRPKTPPKTPPKAPPKAAPAAPARRPPPPARPS
ncbi:hypothetical protein [Polaromonas sp. CG9_12]|nr:hypothetical protein [Polaromonas sp. CG9_12]